jgi:activating signal cointegrator 1
VKALTICQPYAELIARGEKVIENRTWATDYRGPLAIHAGKSRAWLDDDDHPKANYGIDINAIPYGAIVAIVRLRGCVRIEDLPLDLRGSKHANGPWCWVFADIQRIEPISYRGAQGLWDWVPSPSLADRQKEQD